MIFKNYQNDVLLRVDQIKEVEKDITKKKKGIKYNLIIYMINGDKWNLKYENEDERNYDFDKLEKLLQIY